MLILQCTLITSLTTFLPPSYTPNGFPGCFVFFFCSFLSCSVSENSGIVNIKYHRSTWANTQKAHESRVNVNWKKRKLKFDCTKIKQWKRIRLLRTLTTVSLCRWKSHRTKGIERRKGNGIDTRNEKAADFRATMSEKKEEGNE